MTWVIGAVTLPYDPHTVQMKNAADVKAYRIPKGLPLLISFGNKAQVLIIEGYIYTVGQTMTFLETNYITPLENLVATEVTINGPGSRFDGQWLMTKYDHRESRGEVNVCTYRMEFWKGSQFEVI